MFRAACDFDGSDSLKCISLVTGDKLSAVHVLDDTWYIGFNERTKETGAFPAACVEQEEGNEYTPLPAKHVGSDALPEKVMYANVSKLIQDREKRKTSGARAFDVNRLRSTKPERSFKLKLVKSTELKDESVENKPEDVFVIPVREVDRSAARSVRFDDVMLEHSVSVPESVSSWQESSFEDSFKEQSTDRQLREEGVQKKKEKEKADGQYHRLGKWETFKISTEQLFKSPKGEKRVTKAVIGIFSGVLIGALIFLIYRYNFGYTATEAGIITAFLTVLFCFGLAISSFIRCIVALVVPNFFTGIGRAILLSAIFSLILQYPISNISHNAKETGSSMACVLELAANQSKVLQRELAAPLKEIQLYIQEQQQKQKELTDKINSAFSGIRGALKELKGGADSIKDQLNYIQKKCAEEIGKLPSICENMCNSLPSILKSLCDGNLCSSFQISELQTICHGIQVDQRLSDIVNKISAEVEETVSYFEVDIKVSGGIEAEANVSKPAVAIKNEVENDVGEKVRVFREIMTAVQKVLSISLLMIFLQSIWYLRNYLAKDGYDNIYITKQFRLLDKETEKYGRETVLPLKKREVNLYVETRSLKLNRTELGYAKLGLIQVILHMLLCIVIIAFDYALFYILQLVKKHGDVELEIESHTGIKVEVQGSGPVAKFYRVLIEGFSKEHNFNITVDVQPCLPNPKEPSAGIIPVFVIFYVVVFAVVILRAYGMRLRRKVCAYYCPDQELARLDYLHKKIRHKRVGFLNFLRQQIKSTHKEERVKEKLRFSSWLTYNIPVLAHLLPQKTKRECTSCEQKETSFNDVQLSRCEGIRGGVSCKAVYCQECKAALQNVCPLCAGDDEVTLRE